MTDKQAEIAASIQRGRADIAAGRSKSHQEVERLIKSWTTADNDGVELDWDSLRDRTPGRNVDL